MEISLKNKNVIVTGGAGGIGSACVKTFLESGANVAIVDVNCELIEKVVGEFQNLGTVKGYPLNLTDTEQIEKVVQTIRSEMGEIDVLVQTAGLLKNKVGLEIQPEEWDLMMSINSRGLFFMMQQVVKQSMKTRGGAIVNISSMAGIRGMTQAMASAHYSASKGAVVSSSMQAAVEWAQYGIRVNAIAPGGVKTPAMENVKFDTDVLKPVPLGKLSLPQDIANAVVFLSSPQAAMITGQTLVIDGGSSVVGY